MLYNTLPDSLSIRLTYPESSFYLKITSKCCGISLSGSLAIYKAVGLLCSVPAFPLDPLPESCDVGSTLSHPPKHIILLAGTSEPLFIVLHYLHVLSTKGWFFWRQTIKYIVFTSYTRERELYNNVDSSSHCFSHWASSVTQVTFYCFLINSSPCLFLLIPEKN